MEYLRELSFGPGGAYLAAVLDGLASLLAWPGELLVTAFSGAADDETYLARIRDYALPLGIVVWLLASFAARQWWLARRRPHEAQARAESIIRVAREGSIAVERAIAPPLRALERAWSWPLVWGAAWRAQVVHLALYAVLPVLMSIAEAVFFTALFFPGNSVAKVYSSLSHLDHPVCWVFVSNCRSPDSSSRLLTEEEAAQCNAGRCPSPSDTLIDSHRWMWKGAWALITIAWVLRWRKRQKDRAKQPPPA